MLISIGLSALIIGIIIAVVSFSIASVNMASYFSICFSSSGDLEQVLNMFSLHALCGAGMFLGFVSGVVGFFMFLSGLAIQYFAV
jgi:hypothetical protein